MLLLLLICLKCILGKSRLITWIQLAIRYCLKYLCTQSSKNLSALLISVCSPDIHQLKKKKLFSIDSLSIVKSEMFLRFKAELYNLWTPYTSCCPFLYFSSSFAYFKNHNGANLDLYQKVFRGRNMQIKFFLNLTLNYENNISIYLFYLLNKKNLFYFFSFIELPYIFIRPHKYLT